MILHPVTVDNREKSPSPEQRVRELQANGVSAQVGFLEHGDYLWVVEPDPEDTLPWLVVCVERKSIQDLLASAADDRLARYAQWGDDVLKVLLVEGNQFTFPSYGYRDWTADQLDNLLATLQTAGVVVIRSQDQSQTARRLATFWRYTGKSDRGASLARVVRPEISNQYLKEDKKAAVRMLMCLPGWGEARARAAVDAYGSVDAVLEAIRTGDKFSAVHGVGKGLVTKAAEFLAKEV